MTKTTYEIKSKKIEQGWIDGTINGFCFQAKIFNEGSEYGINEGRVSKLRVWNAARPQLSQSIMNYDRGWDIRPKTTADRQMLKALVAYLENLPTSEETVKGFYGKAYGPDGKQRTVYIPSKYEDE